MAIYSFLVAALTMLLLAGCSEDAGTPNLCDTVQCAPASGTVELVESLDGTDSPAVGAVVSVFGTSLRTTTDQSGRFSFDVPVGYVFLESSQDGTWGLIDGYPVSEDGIEGVELIVIADEFVTAMEDDVNRAIDASKGMVFPFFEPASEAGGETVTLSVQHDFSMTVAASGDWILSDTLVGGGEPWLTLAGAEVTDQLTVVATGAEGQTCQLRDCWRDMCFPVDSKTEFPVVAKALTTLEVECAPTTTLPIRTLDVDEPGNQTPLPGVTLCESGTTNCVVSDAMGLAQLRLPVGQEISYTAEKDGYGSQLRPAVVSGTEQTVSLFMRTDALLTTQYGRVSSTYPEVDTGTVFVAVWALGVGGLENATLDLIDGVEKGFYTDAEGRWSPTLIATTSAGTGGFVEVAPGEVEVRIGGAVSGCIAHWGWPSDSANAIRLPVREGFMTVGLADCD